MRIMIRSRSQCVCHAKAASPMAHRAIQIKVLTNPDGLYRSYVVLKGSASMSISRHPPT